tara:strand:+ start:1104 stop:1298 length:195 start_codon:yes stop_codon:yes gene_type:complete
LKRNEDKSFIAKIIDYLATFFSTEKTSKSSHREALKTESLEKRLHDEKNVEPTDEEDGLKINPR